MTVDAPVFEPVGREDSPAHLPYLPQRRRLSRSAGVLGEKVGVKGFSRRSIRQMGERRSVPVSASVAQTEEFHRSVYFHIFTGVAVTLRDRLSRSADPHTCPSGNQAVGRNYSPDAIPEDLHVSTTIEKSALLAASQHCAHRLFITPRPLPIDGPISVEDAPFLKASHRSHKRSPDKRCHPPHLSDRSSVPHGMAIFLELLGSERRINRHKIRFTIVYRVRESLFSSISQGKRSHESISVALFLLSGLKV